MRSSIGIRGLAIGLALVAAQGASGQAADPLQARLTELAGRYAVGGTLVGPARTGTLGEAQEKRIAAQLQANKCYVFIGVGVAELSDLDLALEVEGQRVGEDTQPDNFPVVRACTPVAARVEVVLTATRGAGAYVLGQYDVPAEDAAVPEPPPETPPPAAGPGLEERAGQLAQAQAPDARLDGDVQRGRLLTDEVAAVSRRLRAEICYTFVAVGGAGVQELNLEVTIGSRRVGADTTTGDEAVVASFCPAANATATVRVVMSRGSGEYVFAAYAKEASGEALIEVSGVDSEALARRLAELAAAEATGMTAAGAPSFGSLRQGRSANVTFPVAAGTCYRVFGATESGITNLDLTLLVDGATVGEDVESDATPVVGTCASAAGTARVDIWAVAGSGGYGIGVYRGAQPSAGTADGNPLLGLLDAAATNLAPGATRVSEPFTGNLAVTASQQYDVTLQAGRCYAFVGISDAGNLDLELTAGTVLIGKDDDLDNTPGVKYCARVGLTVRAKLTLLSASGNYAFGVYDAPAVQSSSTQPTVTSTGIAVGGPETDYVANQIRALHRSQAAALLPVSEVQRGTLQQAQTAEFVLNLPAGRCYTIIAAAVPSVRDLDLTLTSPYNQVLATDTTDDPSPVLVTNPCPQWSGDYRIKAYLQYGYGAFGFQVFSQ